METKPVRKSELLKTAIIRYLVAITCVFLILFIPAGDLKYWNGWLFLVSLFIPMIFSVIYFYLKDPALLEKRLKTQEKEKAQKAYIFMSIVVFIISFILPGLDYRFKWSTVPLPIVAIACVLMVLGYILFVIVMIQNSYASRIVEVQENQKIIDTGLYSIVRHPMYLAASMVFVSSPVVLGSYISLIPMILFPIMLGLRIINEEKVLKEGLKGYEEYRKRVKYKMVPFVW